MKLTPEQLAEWKALVHKLIDDSSDHMGVAHSTDMPPQHTVNFRYVKNAHEAAWAITNLIADLEEERRRSSISEAFAKELSSELISTRKQLAEAQARNAQVLSVAEKMRCAGGAQEFQHWFDELKLFLLRKPDTQQSTQQSQLRGKQMNKQPKPFDLEAAKNGKPILFDGKPCKFVAHIPENYLDSMVVIAYRGRVYAFTEDGCYIEGDEVRLTMAPRTVKTVGYRDYYARASGKIYRCRASEGECVVNSESFIRWIHAEWQYDEVEIP